MPNQCSSNPPLSDPAAGPAWNGWGVNEMNTRFQSAKNAGLTAADVPKLKLKWAFGYPTGVSAFGQPTIASGRVFVGTDTGYVYSLDAKTGCVYWSFQTKGSVRNAISIGPVKHRDGEICDLLRRRALERVRRERAEWRAIVDGARRPALHCAYHRGAYALSESIVRAGIVVGRILRVDFGLPVLHFSRERRRLRRVDREGDLAHLRDSGRAPAYAQKLQGHSALRAGGSVGVELAHGRRQAQGHLLRHGRFGDRPSRENF